MGQAFEETELRLEGRAEHAAELAHVRAAAHDEAGLLAHLRQEPRAPARAVREQIALAVLVRVRRGTVDGVLPEVAVAQDGVDPPQLRKAHDIAQRLKAVTALFEEVPAEDERVLLPERQLCQQAPEIGQVAVDI